MIIFHWINQYRGDIGFFNILTIGFTDYNRPYIIIMGLGLELIFVEKVRA